MSPEAHKELVKQILENFDPTEEVFLIAKYNTKTELLESGMFGVGAVRFTQRETLLSIMQAITDQLTTSKEDVLKLLEEKPN